MFNFFNILSFIFSLSINFINFLYNGLALAIIKIKPSIKIDNPYLNSLMFQRLSEAVPLRCYRCNEILTKEEKSKYDSFDSNKSNGPYCSKCYDLKYFSCNDCHKVRYTHTIICYSDSNINLRDDCFEKFINKHTCFFCHKSFSKTDKIYKPSSFYVCESCYSTLKPYNFGVFHV